MRLPRSVHRRATTGGSPRGGAQEIFIGAESVGGFNEHLEPRRGAIRLW